jgi:hypothetical protein
METLTAQARMKALVAARLLMGDFDDWNAFERERTAATAIENRRMARSASAQISRSYRDLAHETEKFISQNFENCTTAKLADLCERIVPWQGIYLPLAEFEKLFFEITKRVKDRVPTYAHVSVTPYGLQFEFPEHHFIRDLSAALTDLDETLSRIDKFKRSAKIDKEYRPEISDLVAQQKFLCRSIISAAFSLVEAFVSGLFFTAVHTKLVGVTQCSEDFVKYAASKDSASLKERIDRILREFLTAGTSSKSEPFSSFLDVAKKYRDAIHHTTPFARGSHALVAGQRLLVLYEIDDKVALQCLQNSLDTLLTIAKAVWQSGDQKTIVVDCEKLRARATSLRASKTD